LAISSTVYRWAVLDEATSALDAESERAIGETLNKLKGNLTIVVIAHRPAMVALADRVLKLREGSIVKEGSHL